MTGYPDSAGETSVLIKRGQNLRTFLTCILVFTAPGAGSQPPSYLDILTARYSHALPALDAYASRQGFTSSAERTATRHHELIHIDSAAHGGFAVAGTYIAPYLSPDYWPALSNRDLVPVLTSDDIYALGPIYTSYLPSTPDNRIQNVLDELNAYTQSLPALCEADSQHALPHVKALAGHVALLDLYLRHLAGRHPDQYRQMATNRVARGALETITSNAYRTLNWCAARVPSAAPVQGIPSIAIRAFAALPPPRT